VTSAISWMAADLLGWTHATMDVCPDCGSQRQRRYMRSVGSETDIVFLCRDCHLLHQSRGGRSVDLLAAVVYFERPDECVLLGSIDATAVGGDGEVYGTRASVTAIPGGMWIIETSTIHRSSVTGRHLRVIRTFAEVPDWLHDHRLGEDVVLQPWTAEFVAHMRAGRTIIKPRSIVPDTTDDLEQTLAALATSSQS
jgi:hypothetical protein